MHFGAGENGHDQACRRNCPLGWRQSRAVSDPECHPDSELMSLTQALIKSLTLTLSGVLTRPGSGPVPHLSVSPS